MESRRIEILDGWRALSILFVLAGHLLPLGPKAWQLNSAFALSGLALFFVLSGFLITRFLLEKQDVADFLRRRLFRIVPLAWLAMLILAAVERPDMAKLALNLLFVANLVPGALMEGGGHLWSLCVEAQFYVGIALLVALSGRRGLYILPLLCVAVTALRIHMHAQIDIATWLRADEILAGATLALLCHDGRAAGWMKRLPVWLPVLLLLVLLASGRQNAGLLHYVRPYAAAGAIGLSIYAFPAMLRRIFVSRPAAYVAGISYALYVYHGMLAASWLGTGDALILYLKRPFLIAATFATAHFSTRYFERPFLAYGKRAALR
ncbi:hypothetical protein ASE00_02170 [Sphingomonas sp. Root710]|uniref:acyltransferase family protein n=1 Tax=Sphingomonas sp. Root710 TaxID=1736594 RepID=UPI0006FD0C33|nr:acyltransferase [Sphingomonas sp. Root710]KRB85618.1 hypothetical protein ASE00_02170 [Sphingomonas sp. Root710]